MEAIKRYLREHYTDEKLAALLAHAQDGKLSFNSCCCFIGVATSNHELQGADEYSGYDHYLLAREFSGAMEAATEYCWKLGKNDEERRAAIIPVILEEMERRKRERI